MLMTSMNECTENAAVLLGRKWRVGTWKRVHTLTSTQSRQLSTPDSAIRTNVHSLHRSVDRAHYTTNPFSLHPSKTTSPLKTSLNTSLTSSTYTNRIPVLTLSGTFSSISALFAAGAMIVLIPARCAAKIFSFRPPTGSTWPTREISPVIASREACVVTTTATKD